MFTQFAIIGGGPGGVQLAYFLEQQGADYVVLEKADVPGSSFQLYPRHRTLISINKRFTGSDCPEFNMRHDWNSLLCDEDDFRFKNYDKEFFPHADNLVRYLADYVKRFNIKIQYNFHTQSISKRDGFYCIRDLHGNEHRCQVLIVATGYGKSNVPQIEGIEHAISYSEMSLDLRDFEDKRVLIIGKKNSGFETADHLTPAAAMIHLASPSSIKMAWKTHYVGDLRAVNNSFLDTYQLKSQNAILDANISKILKHGDQYNVTIKYMHSENEVEEIVYDTILCCAGFKIDTSIFDESTKPELVINGKFPALTPAFQSINNQDMYFAGTLTHSLDYRKQTSAFIHGFRYNSRALAIMLMNKYNKKDIPSEILNADSKELTHQILNRVNCSGGLWQQPGFLADACIQKNNKIMYIKELPKDYFLETYTVEDMYLVTLEYGAPIIGDAFSVARIHRENVQEAEASQFLHPVVRRYVQGKFVAKHDVIEDLEANWVEPEHVEPLIKFFDDQKAIHPKL